MSTISKTNKILPFIFPYKERINITLSNGSQLIIYDSEHYKSLFSMFVSCGSNNEGFENIKTKEFKIIHGLAHLIEHLFFTNNKLISELTTEGEEYNASTDDNITNYYFTSQYFNFENSLDMIIDILLNIDKQLEEKIINSQIQAITNENIKNLSIEILNIYKIVKDVSDNIFFKRDDCGNEKTLNIKEIVDFAKLFYSTYYVPENIKFVIFTNFDKVNIENIKEKFNVYSNLYTKSFIEEKLKLNKHFKYLINREKAFELLTSKDYIKTKKILFFYNEHKNDIFIFFNVKSINQNYINFLHWIFNRKDKKGIKELLKKYFNVIEISFSSVFVYKYNLKNIYTCYFQLTLNDKNLDNDQQIEILNFIYSYIEDLKNINEETFNKLIHLYKIEKYFSCNYSSEFSSHSTDLLTSSIYQNVKLNFNEKDLLLKEYENDFNFKFNGFIKTLRFLNVSDSLIFFYLNNRNILNSSNSKIITFTGYELNYIVHDFKFKIKKNIKLKESDFIYDEKINSEFKKMLKITKKNKNNSIIPIFKTSNLILNFGNFYNINKIPVTIGYSEFLSFHISSLINIQIHYENNKDIIYQILNVLLIFEHIIQIIRDKFIFLDSSDFLIFYKFDDSTYEISIFIRSLKDYYFIIFDNLLKMILNFTNENPKYEKINEKLERYYENIKFKISKIIENDRFRDIKNIKKSFYENYVNLKDILKMLEDIRKDFFIFDLKIFKIRNLEIISSLPVEKTEEKEKTLTVFLNQIYLLTNEIIINDKDHYLDFKKLKEDFNLSNVIIKYYNENREIRKSGFFNNMYYILLGDIVNNNLVRNFIFSFLFIIPIIEIYPYIFILDVIKNVLYNCYFNIFRTEKEYSYSVFIQFKQLEKEYIIFKFSMVINNEKINNKFIFKIYNEVKEFVKSSLSIIEKITDDEINLQINKHIDDYTKIYDNDLANIYSYDKIKSKYGFLLQDNELKMKLKNISTSDFINFYKQYFINNDLILFISDV